MGKMSELAIDLQNGRYCEEFDDCPYRGGCPENKWTCEYEEAARDQAENSSFDCWHDQQ